jgi:nitrite reductase/ring-hydroxylating ferredoxin subunit
MTAPRRVPLSGVEELVVGEVAVVPLPRSATGIPREALLLRLPSGELRAYLNRCQHLPIPIDSGSRQFLSDDRRHLVCLTHGARYRIEDGFCVAGPCSGQALEGLEIAREGDELVVLVRD